MEKIGKRNIRDILALTPMQEGMLYHYLMEPEADIYFEQLSLRICGPIDISRFEKAWNFVIEANEMLRVVFRWEKMKNPVQMVLKKYYLKPKYYNLSTRSSEKKESIEKIKIQDKKEKFDLQEVPFRITLCKFNEDNHVMIISHHHILYDGWSTGIILGEFFQAYDKLGNRSGKPLKPPVKTKFKEYIQWIQNRAVKEVEKFWKEYLAGFDTISELPIKIRKGKEKKIIESANYKLRFSKDFINGMEDWVKRYKITLAALLYAGWGILLQKYSNRDDVMFGTTVSGRSASIKGIEDMVGLFINTIPFRIKVDLGETIIGLAYRIKDILSIREKYESTPLVDIKEYSQLENSQVLFDSIMVLENYPLDRSLMQKNSQFPLVVDSYSMVESTNYDLSISITMGEIIGINFIYNPAALEGASILRLSSHFSNIIENILINPGNELSQIEILSEEEKKQILYDFNDTEAAYPKNKTIHQLVAEQAEITPDNIAVVGRQLEQLPQTHEKLEGTGELTPLSLPIFITYKELERKSDQLVHGLKINGVNPDTIVGLIIERSIEMVIGILGILKAGGAYLPIDPEYPRDRIYFMLKDSNVGVLVTTPKLQVKVKVEKNDRQPVLPLQVIHIFTDPAFASEKYLSTSTCQVSPTNLAYVIYTSGSAGKPKGVLVEHASVVNLAYSQMEKFDINAQDKILQFSTICFDASVEQIFITLFSGAVLVLIDKNTLLDNIQFEAFAASHSITHIHAVPSFLSNMKLGHRSTSQLKRVISGGDICPPDLARRWMRYCDFFYNKYGPTETTVTSIEMKVKKIDKALPNLPIGKPINNTTVYLLDKWMKPVPLGVVGELYIGGDGVARGYLNRPGLTAEKFDHDLWDYQDYRDKKKKIRDKNHIQSCNHAAMQSCIHTSMQYHSPTPQYPLTPLHHSPNYRTGDLARWLPHGNIEFLGRIDHQVKIRGFRIELGEIELALLEHSGIKAAAVIVKEPKINTPAAEKGESYLCAYIVPQPGNTISSSTDTSHLHHYLSGKLPEYMIPAYFVILEHLPLTSNGKLDRKALPEPKLNLTHQYMPPGNRREERLVEIYSQILEIKKEKISIDANFFELGGHSLKATRLINSIHKEFGIRLDLAECLKTPTIRQIGEFLQSSANDNGDTPIMPVEEKEYYPLSSAQERLYTLQQMDRENIAYNIFCSRIFDGKINKEKLEWAFRRLIHRHESLRTSFVIIAGQIVQRIYPEVTFAFERCSLPIKHFIRPFDLSQAPLLRVGLVIHEDKKLTLSIDIHHIITDGVSQAVLIKELIRLYQGEALPPPRLRYKDFSQWQQQWKKEENKRQETFWIEEFQDKIPCLNMPTDFSRPEVQSFAGDLLIFELNKNETDRIKKMARQESVTTFMMLLAVYYVFLAEVSFQEDIVVGVPTDGRRYADLDNIIGMFVNTLALRNFPRGDLTFRELLKNVKTRTLKAFENQDYQFDDLVEQLLSTRDARRNPIFDVMFTYNSWKDEPYDLNLENILNKTARFDLILHSVEKNKTFYFAFEYSTRLFKKETIERFVVYLKKILSAVLENPDKNISEIEIISDEEKNRLIRGIKNKDEKSAALMEHAVRNKAKGQKLATKLTADFDF